MNLLKSQIGEYEKLKVPCFRRADYDVFNKIRSKKTILAYPFNEHEGGGAIHGREKLKFFKRHI